VVRKVHFYDIGFSATVDQVDIQLERSWRRIQCTRKLLWASLDEQANKPSPDAKPRLRVSLECPSEISIASLARATVKIRVTYERVDNDDNHTCPITVHDYMFDILGILDLYQRRDDDT
jgi:hypothetical protein